MVRRCCVLNCSETDLTILAHRFPKGDQIAIQWQNVLNLNSISLETLRQNYVVCTKHFSSKAYRNAISNSLNTTALPSLYVHDDNERIESTRMKDKSKNVPTRCHKSPNSLKRQEQTVCIVKNLTASPAKRAKIDLEIFAEHPVGNLETIEDPIALIGHPVTLAEDQVVFTEDPVNLSEDPVEKLEPIHIEEGYVDYEIYDKTEVSEQITLIPDQVSKSVQTELEHIDREIQTDKVEDPVKEILPTDSKDDKLINLLYPEFNGKSKIELVKMIIERNQKVKSLEEEKQMLEDAMRKLL